MFVRTLQLRALFLETAAPPEIKQKWLPEHDCSIGMGINNRYPSLFDPDSLMHAAELQLLQAEYQRALQEPPWDGT